MLAAFTVAAGRAPANTAVSPDPEYYPEPLEAFDLSELTLWVSYPDPNPYRAFARVRDPKGYFHRVVIGTHIGKNYGVVMKITANTIIMSELYIDLKGDWSERYAVLEKRKGG